MPRNHRTPHVKPTQAERPPFIWLVAELLQSLGTGYEKGAQVYVSDHALRGHYVVFNGDPLFSARTVMAGNRIRTFRVKTTGMLGYPVKAEDQMVLHQNYQTNEVGA